MNIKDVQMAFYDKQPYLPWADRGRQYIKNGEEFREISEPTRIDNDGSCWTNTSFLLKYNKKRSNCILIKNFKYVESYYNKLKNLKIID